MKQSYKSNKNSDSNPGGYHNGSYHPNQSMNATGFMDKATDFLTMNQDHKNETTW